MALKEIPFFFDRLAGLILLHLLKVPVLSEQLALHVVVQLAKLLITLVEDISLILLNLQRQFQYKYFVHFTFNSLHFWVINTFEGIPTAHEPVNSLHFWVINTVLANGFLVVTTCH